MAQPGALAAGVAGGAPTDWALYDTHYVEQFMDSPAANPEGFRRSAVLTHVAALNAPLLLMHGMADDNVHFANATRLIQRLQALYKPFDLALYPIARHGVLRDPATAPGAYKTMLAFFDRTLRGR